MILVLSLGFHLHNALSRNDFIESTRATGSHEVIFAVKQRNLDIIERHVLKVSDPKNVEYGAYLSRFEMAELSANPESSEVRPCRCCIIVYSCDISVSVSKGLHFYILSISVFGFSRLPS